MTYTRQVQIEFNHCDPAGIVFYPRYFEMTNSVAENFFADVVGCSFARMFEEKLGASPTVHVEVDFTAPSRLGETIDFALDVLSVGSASVRFAIRAEKERETRLAGEFVIVWVDRKGRTRPWPEAMKQRLEAAMQGGNDR